MAETIKSHKRRIEEGWFDKYAPTDLPGIDIGCGFDPLNHTFRRFDLIYGDGDAQLMEAIPNNVFNTVYASHVLEHLKNPIEGLKNWYRICRSPGHVIVCVPHRDLYEKRKRLPSNWNKDHKTFWLPEIGESPFTLGLREVAMKAIPDVNIVSLRVLDKDYSANGEEHASGEFSIELIIRK